jgi:molybdopterin-containing oxidoreductase family iron-sulfur binding subunit
MMKSTDGTDHAPVVGTSDLVESRLDENGTRRQFLKLAGAAAAATAAVAATGCGVQNDPTFQEFFQKHYKKLTDEDKKKIFARIEAETLEKTGVTVKVGDPQPIPDVEFAYGLNLSVCNGNRRCVEACARENNLPDDIRYIRVLEMENGSFDMEHAEHFYEHALVPQKGKYYLPVQCQHCENAPCVKACPTGATWSEPDGIVVVDYNWCIGCRYCMAACPYFARRFNWDAPQIPPEKINPNQAYLSNRIRPVGVVEKCTFCLQRTRKGRYPACLEACPTGARKFGNMKDPSSEIRQILETKRVYVLKEELGTLPRFFYFFG